MHKSRLSVVIAGTALALSLGAVGCTPATSGTSSTTDTAKPAEATQSAETTSSATLPNPLTEYKSADELKEATGFSLKMPEDATDVTYSAITDEGLAQVMGTLDGVEVTVRMKATSAEEDISGVYQDTWDEESTYTASDGMSINMKVATGNVAVLSCYVEDSKATYCTILTGDKVTVDLAKQIDEKIAALYQA